MENEIKIAEEVYNLISDFYEFECQLDCPFEQISPEEKKLWIEVVKKCQLVR